MTPESDLIQAILEMYSWLNCDDQQDDEFCLKCRMKRLLQQLKREGRLPRGWGDG